MVTTALDRKRRVRTFGPPHNGIPMTTSEFDRAQFTPGWRYELINGVLIVTSTPARSERDPNQYLGHLLLVYQETHPHGKALDDSLPEEIVDTGVNRRRADRVLWTGLGRRPTPNDSPTIVVEFVSEGRRNWRRDYEVKRDEYLAIGVYEYWIIDRFERSMTVFNLRGKRVTRRVFSKNQTYKSDLLPGFDLPIGRLLARSDRWDYKRADSV